MANAEHLSLLKRGVDGWNRWRETNRDVTPDLWSARLEDTFLAHANLSNAILNSALLDRADMRYGNLSESTLRSAFLRGTCLNRATLCGADLDGAVLVGVNMNDANLSGCKLHCEIAGGSMTGSIFTNAQFRGGNVRDANLFGAILSEVDLSGTNLDGSNLGEANLHKAILRNSSLRGTNLEATNLSEADLSGADLTGARLVRTNLEGADLTGSQVFATSVWDARLNHETKQSNLRVGPQVMLDNLEVAQFIYLILNNQKIRDVIDTITSRAVLILGRFTPERKIVLAAIQEGLRHHNHVPLVFDFDRPTERDFTETIMILAGMSRFIIADITNPSSSPLELQALVPNYMVPFVPIIQRGEKPFSMFTDLGSKFDWVLDTLVYDSPEDLSGGLDKAVIAPALEKQAELMIRKTRHARSRDIREYL